MFLEGRFGSLLGLPPQWVPFPLNINWGCVVCHCSPLFPKVLEHLNSSLLHGCPTYVFFLSSRCLSQSLFVISGIICKE
jgi:hypothetical protein